jgi:hypothetical protein
MMQTYFIYPVDAALLQGGFSFFGGDTGPFDYDERPAFASVRGNQTLEDCLPFLPRPY